MKQPGSLSTLAWLVVSVTALPALLATGRTAAVGKTGLAAASLAQQASPGHAFPLSGLQGHIRDANTGQGLAGYVYLYDAGDPDVEHDAYADPAGAYYLSVPDPGTYDVYGTMIGYERIDATGPFIVFIQSLVVHHDLEPQESSGHVFLPVIAQILPRQLAVSAPGSVMAAVS